MWNQTEKFFLKQSELICCLKFMPWDLNKTLPVHTYIYLANRPYSKVKQTPVFLETCVWILFFPWTKFPKVKCLIGWLMSKAWGENKILYFSSRKHPGIWILDPMQPSSKRVTSESLLFSVSAQWPAVVGPGMGQEVIWNLSKPPNPTTPDSIWINTGKIFVPKNTLTLSASLIPGSFL